MQANHLQRIIFLPFYINICVSWQSLRRSCIWPDRVWVSWPPAGQKSRVNRGWPGIGGGGLKASRLLQTDGPQQWEGVAAAGKKTKISLAICFFLLQLEFSKSEAGFQIMFFGFLSCLVLILFFYIVNFWICCHITFHLLDCPLSAECPVPPVLWQKQNRRQRPNFNFIHCQICRDGPAESIRHLWILRLFCCDGPVSNARL